MTDTLHEMHPGQTVDPVRSGRAWAQRPLQRVPGHSYVTLWHTRVTTHPDGTRTITPTQPAHLTHQHHAQTADHHATNTQATLDALHPDDPRRPALDHANEEAP